MATKTDDAVKNLSGILIRAKETVPGWSINGHVYEVKTKVPAPALVALTIEPNVALGMKAYILECLASQEDRDKFSKEIFPNTDVKGLSDIIEEIVTATTPFDSEKPND